MSRIEELELRIKHLHVGKETIETSLATQQEIILEAEKELADLKADRPREWMIFLSSDGRMSALPWHATQLPTIVIEKKPIVITTELAQKMIDAGRGFVVTPAWFVRALKAAGIEARCGDE